MRTPSAIRQLLGSATIAPLLEHVRRLQTLDQQLRQCCSDDALAGHLQVADWRDGCLYVQADSAAWSTRLRFLTPQILTCLRLQKGLAGLRQIKVHIRPAATAHVRIPEPSILPPGIGKLLQETADDVSHQPLRAALLRLSRHSIRAGGQP